MVFSVDHPSRSVLLLRAKRQQEPIVAMLGELGISVTHIPLMRIQFFDSEEEKKTAIHALSHFLHIDKVVVTSVNAARMLVPLLGEVDGIDFATEFFAIGQSTRMCLADSGVAAKSPGPDMNSEGLLSTQWFSNLQGQIVALFTGVGGRTLLEDECRKRGAAVVKVPLYQREICSGLDGELENYFSSVAEPVVVVHSAELLEALIGQLSGPTAGLLQKSHLVVPGPRIEKIAREQGFDRVVLASSPMPEDMVSSIVDCYSKK